eukprot:Sdes_comp25571_c0_seq1m22805
MAMWRCFQRVVSVGALYFLAGFLRLGESCKCERSVENLYCGADVILIANETIWKNISSPSSYMCVNSNIIIPAEAILKIIKRPSQNNTFAVLPSFKYVVLHGSMKGTSCETPSLR